MARVYLAFLLFHCATETWEHNLSPPHPQPVITAWVQMGTISPYPTTDPWLHQLRVT